MPRREDLNTSRTGSGPGLLTTRRSRADDKRRGGSRTNVEHRTSNVQRRMGERCRANHGSAPVPDSGLLPALGVGLQSRGRGNVRCSSPAGWPLTFLALLFSLPILAGPPYKCGVCPKTSVTVTDERASSGTKSLKFADHPQAKRPGYPYLFMAPNFLKQGARFSCSLYLELDATAHLEFRSAPSARTAPVGPAIRFSREGVSVAGKRVASMPTQTWVNVSVHFRFGTGTFDLTVTPANDEPVALAGLPCRNADFRTCTWVGIISPGKTNAAFYLDDLELLPLAESR